ncbi:hypothetical protein [Mesorhizobium sp. WSM2239]|uniref:Uncharacterized protein n=2 Tax=unclassified Mesorhizobium TaxID=325217 RepID=A0AAU8D730_9HYPH
MVRYDACLVDFANPTDERRLGILTVEIVAILEKLPIAVMKDNAKIVD